MKFLAEKMNDFLADEQGATAVEYGIFVALIAALIVTIVSGIGVKIQVAFQKILDAL